MASATIKSQERQETYDACGFNCLSKAYSYSLTNFSLKHNPPRLAENNGLVDLAGYLNKMKFSPHIPHSIFSSDTLNRTSS